MSEVTMGKPRGRETRAAYGVMVATMGAAPLGTATACAHDVILGEHSVTSSESRATSSETSGKVADLGPTQTVPSVGFPSSTNVETDERSSAVQDALSNTNPRFDSDHDTGHFAWDRDGGPRRPPKPVGPPPPGPWPTTPSEPTFPFEPPTDDWSGRSPSSSD